MMDNWEITQEIDLACGADGLKTQKAISLLAYPGNRNAHTWKITVKENKIPKDLSNYNVIAYFMRADGNTVYVEGSHEDNIAYVTFKPEVYAISGQVKAEMVISIPLEYDITIGAITFDVPQNMAGNIIDPGSIIPASVDDLIGMLEEMQSVTEAAEAASTKSVRYDSAQLLTYNQKLQARTNINGADADVVSELELSVENLDETVETQQILIDGKIDGGYVEDGALYLTANGVVVAGPFDGIGGGGGGGGNNAVMTMHNMTGWLTKTISEGASCPIQFSWSSLEDEIPTGNGTLQVRVNDAVRSTLDVAQGSITIDVGPYLASGNNVVKMVVSDAYGNSRTLNYTIKAVAISISSAFDAGVPQTGAIEFAYTPIGNVSKTVYIVVDGVTVDTQVVTASGRQQTALIDAQSHGAHKLLVYFTCEIDGETVTSNELYYEIICLESGNTTPVITSTYRATNVEQYVTQKIPYRVYTPNLIESTVTLWADNQQIGEALTVDRTEHVWTYRPDNIGTHTLEIRSGAAVRTFTLTVAESSIDIEPVSEDLELYLNSFGRSNNEQNPGTWTYGSVECQFSGFNWTSDGWKLDEEGNTALRLNGSARLTIPFKIFENDFRSTGKTIEIDFATRDVLNYDATILSCMSEERGISMSAQRVTMNSEQSSMTTQYKEDEHVRLSFVVEKSSENRLLLCYINGILSGVIQYPADDDFSQMAPVNITVGSSECGIDLYCIRVYKNDLTREQVLNNWIADTQTIDQRLERYNRNNVYDEYSKIVISKLPSDLPYLVLTAPELPQYKGDKKTISGYYVNPANPSKNFTFENAKVDVQGTSSQYYARKNYKIKFEGGFTRNGETSPTYKMRNDSIATKTFTFKADVASSEGANNVELARLYNDSCTYKTPPQKDNASIRQGIDGFPIVVFWNNGEETTFIGKYNFNNDKGTDEVFGFEEGDESWETKNNTSDRVIWKSADYNGVAWLNDFEGRYPEDNTNPENLARLAAWIVSTDQSAATGDALPNPVTLHHRTYDSEGNLVETDVVYSNDTADYRLDKFRDELSDHVMVDSALFYYLFTELFLMVDSRAKNAFPTMYHGDNGKWCFLPYDFDTALGINNEGALAFGYELEDIDKTSSGANVFNGQDSVLWINIRQGFFEELKAMYKSLRSAGIVSYNNVEAMFEEHQSKWPEAVFNEDAYYKYLEPLISKGDGSYLEMCQGSKAEQRKWWLYNRFRYIDSKYNAGDALSDYIDMRSYARSNVTITPYADIYPTMKFGSYFVSERGRRNTPTTLECPGTFTPNDTETQIYCASQLASVGDLSGLKLGRCDFHMATRLQSLKIGDASSSYSNGNLTSLTLGNNVLLQTLDVRNCPNLAQAVDISGCTGIEEVYLDGTAVTGLNLPNGGRLHVLHLPATVTNLTIRNHSEIIEFVLPSYTNITTLRLENVNSVVPSKTILEAIPANSRVRLLGVDWTVDNVAAIVALYDLLDTMRGLDEQGNNLENAVISGTIHVENITGAELAELQQRQPNVRIAYTNITSNLYYYNYDGTQLLNTETIANGGDGTYSVTPTRASTAQYTYTFVGWSLNMNSTTADANAVKGVTTDRNVYAAYSRATRKYTVRFMNGSTVLQTVNNVPYGGNATYTGSTPVHPDDPDNFEFTKFVPDGKNITGATDCVAQYKYNGLVETITDSWQEIIENVNNGTYSQKYNVGDTKILELSNDGRICMQIAAFDADNKADGSGMAAITWLSQQVTEKTYKINSGNKQVDPNDSTKYVNGTGAVGGWGTCELRNTLKTEILPQIQTDILNAIVEVKKYSYAITTTLGKSANSESIDDIWIPSLKELGFSNGAVNTSIETKGPVYSGVFPSRASTIKTTVNNPNVYADYWTRTAYSGTGLGNDFNERSNNNESNMLYRESVTSKKHVCFGFCM